MFLAMYTVERRHCTKSLSVPRISQLTFPAADVAVSPTGHGTRITEVSLTLIPRTIHPP